MNIIILSAFITLAIFCIIMMIVWDFRARIIPDVYLFPFLLIGLLICDNFNWISGGIGESVITAVIGYAVGFIMNLVFKSIKKKQSDHDPIGMGDIKLLAAGGIWLGITGLSFALIAACILGVAWALFHKQRFVPFAPFFFIGGAVAVAVMQVI